MSHEWYCSIQGNVSGPYTSAELQSLADQGKLTPDEHVRRNSDGDWVRASLVKGLKFTDKPPLQPYRIKGTDPQTGREREVTVLATSQDEANRRAAESGILTGTLHDAVFQQQQDELRVRQAKSRKEQERAKNAHLCVGPQQWRYLMVQMPPLVEIDENVSQRGVAASHLAETVTKYAELGWEFYRIDEIGVQVNPGCLTALLGGRSTRTSYYVVTFRAPA